MKKIIISMILAVSLMAFIGCNNGNNADDDVTPAELLKNIPVTTADLTNMLYNQSRAADSNNEPLEPSDLVPFILKTLISETTGLEFGKNKTIGFIGTFSDNARQEFAKVYGDQTDIYLQNYSQRNFGSVRVDMNNDKVTIFWYMPENETTDGTFPDCSIYINGTYKNGYYESIEIYGENYSYVEGNAYPIYEKKYVSGDKVISKSVTLKDSTLAKNQVSKKEVTSTGVTKSTESYSSDLPTQTNIDGYHQKIQNWYSTIN